jgi:hypothetical protein
MNNTCSFCEKIIEYNLPVCWNCYRHNRKARELQSAALKEINRKAQEEAKKLYEEKKLSDKMKRLELAEITREERKKQKKIDKWYGDAGISR